jgi:pimeloyl-ACP methyl ester carboxylesterase
LDGERLLRFRQAVGLPGFNRLLRLAETTCGNDAKVPAGLTEELIQSVTQPVLAIFGEHSPFLATSDYLAQHLPHCVPRTVKSAKHRAPEENGAEFVEIVNEFLIANSSPARMARAAR